MYDSDPRYSAKELDEAGYMHAIAGSLGFGKSEKIYFDVHMRTIMALIMGGR